MNEPLTNRLLKVEIESLSDRMLAMKEIEGNPQGIEHRRFGEAEAFYSRNMPWGMFNNVKGKLSVDDIDPIIDFYKERERRFEFQLVPGGADEPVFRRLAERGFYQSAFHATMYAEAGRFSIEEDGVHHKALDSNCEIRELTMDEFDDYALVHCLGSGLPINGVPHVAANNRILFDRPGWKYWIGRYCNGSEYTPAAVGVMFAGHETAHCTFAATIPEFRHKGFQGALLRERIKSAFDAGATIVSGGCAYGSASYRNMKRAGMEVAFTRATWTALA